MASGSQDEDVTCFKYAASAYPRYRYAAQYVRPLIIKCQGLLRKCGIKDDRRIPDFQSVTLATQGYAHAPVLNKSNHTTTGDECLASCTLIDYQTGKTQQNNGNPVIFVAKYHPSRTSDTGVKHLGDCVVLINNQLSADEHYDYVHVTTQDSFATLVATLLERLVFRWLRGLVQALTVFDSFAKQGDAADRSEYGTQLFAALTDMVENSSGRTSTQAFDTLDQYFHLVGRTSPEENITANIELVAANKGLIKDTIFEAMVTYRRSRVPRDEWPRIEFASIKITDEVHEAVRKIDGAIECGMRYGTFCVYVGQQSAYQSDEEVARQLEPKLLLNGIMECKILRQVQENPLAAHCCSGSTIRAMGNGTLGGFAIKGESTIALLAKHVVGDENDVHIVDENVHHHIGHVLKPLVELNFPAPLDIAAALVIVEIPDRRFKNIDGKSIISELFDFDQGNLDFLEALPVHIWGASSKPGYGQITTCDSQTVEGMNNIVIEDSTVDYYEPADRYKPFAKKGDSGSIVCSEDPDGKFIHVIGMLMGERVVKDANNQRKQYLAFPLQHGLRQLSREQNEADDHFKLC